MKNTKTKITAITLTALMAVSTLGAVSASAAEVPTDSISTRTIYFVNNKDWADVYEYSWNSATKTENAAFPGVELEAVGTTDVLGTSKEVYEFTVNTNEFDSIIFSEGTEHGQQSKDLNLNWTQTNGFCLDKDNYLQVIPDFGATDVTYATPMRTMTAKTSTQTSVRPAVNVNCNNCLKSDGSLKLFIDTKSEPQVTLTNLNCSSKTVKAQKNDNGMYFVTVPEGSYISATITVDGKTATSGITNTTDAVKVSTENNRLIAEPCQRVYFNNNLSTKSVAGQVVKAYAWNSVSSYEETSFADAQKMTYAYNDSYGVNVYFYDVPLTCDHVIFFTADYSTGATTAKTMDIQLNTTTNTQSNVIMDGYYVTNTSSTMSQSVSTYDNQVIA